MPPPEGLPPNAWRYFALFAAVIAGIITEPIPAAAVGLTGVVIATVLGLVHADAGEATDWALSGFGNDTVWLIFAAYMLAMGYEKTGLGKRIALGLIRTLGKRTLGLGFSIAMAELALAPFMPSSTARSGGTIYPIISNIPGLFGSRPHDPSRRKIGSYLMYTALASTCVTSSMFLTGHASKRSPGPTGSKDSRRSGSSFFRWCRCSSTRFIHRKSANPPTPPAGRKTNCDEWVRLRAEKSGCWVWRSSRSRSGSGRPDTWRPPSQRSSSCCS
jgi:anion transporter